MKKYFSFILLLAPAFAFAQPHMGIGSIKFGVFDPSATNAGFIIGYEGGRGLDRNFAIGWSIDWFHKDYVDQNLVSEFNSYYGVNGSLNELRASTNLHAIPVMVNATTSWPLAPRSYAFFTAAIGLETLLIYYNNYDNPGNNEFHSAFDFAWQLGGGIAYELGPRSDIIFELAYHYSQPSWEYDVTDPVTGRTRTFEQSFDMSGIMFRTGFRFYF
jgi:opacity protein-like surface antigen